MKLSSAKWQQFSFSLSFPDSKVHGANMGPIWGRQDPGGSHVGPMNFTIWVVNWTHCHAALYTLYTCKEGASLICHSSVIDYTLALKANKIPLH